MNYLRIVSILLLSCCCGHYLSTQIPMPLRTNRNPTTPKSRSRHTRIPTSLCTDSNPTTPKVAALLYQNDNCTLLYMYFEQALVGLSRPGATSYHRSLFYIVKVPNMPRTCRRSDFTSSQSTSSQNVYRARVCFDRHHRSPVRPITTGNY